MVTMIPVQLMYPLRILVYKSLKKNDDGFQVYYENAHRKKFVLFQIFAYKNLRVSSSIIKN